MSVLQSDLDKLDDQINELKQRKVEAISKAQYTMEHLERTTRYHSKERYYIVRADGDTVDFRSMFVQAPAAKRHFKYLCQVYSNNVYFFDKKNMALVTADGEVRNIEFPKHGG